MHGIGNDFVMINGFKEQIEPALRPALARSMCDRRFGIGSDGVIFAEQGASGALAMRMFNPDGSESEMCGNGIRCMLAFALQEGLAKEPVLPVETGAGLLVLESVADGRVRVDMGLARLDRGAIGMQGDPDSRFVGEEISALGQSFKGTAVSMGNPHLVLPVEDVASIDLDRLGPAFEHHPLFPNRVNVHFIQVASRTHLIQRTWERAAGATLACGTGACASVVAAVECGLSERIALVTLPGGELEIDYRTDGRVFMTGPAEKSFDGTWPTS
jgi:diaminopimelate epimerase